MAICIRRRQFIGFIGGAAIGWPYVAAGQQSGSVRLIGVLMGGYVPADPDGQKYLAASLKGTSRTRLDRTSQCADRKTS